MMEFYQKSWNNFFFYIYKLPIFLVNSMLNFFKRCRLNCNCASNWADWNEVSDDFSQCNALFQGTLIFNFVHVNVDWFKS